MPIDFTELQRNFYESPDGVNNLNQILRTIANNIAGDTESVRIYSGYGSPESVITAGIGSMYMRLDGGANTSVYRKESGTGNTGWVANVNLTIPISLANGGTGASLVDPGADRVLFWDDSAGAFTFLTAGSGLDITNTTLTATPGLSLVSTTTVSTATNSGDIAITSTKTYLVRLRITAMSGAENMALRFNNDSTANTYSYVVRGFNVAATGVNLNANATADKILMLQDSVGAQATQNINVEFTIPMQSGSNWMHIKGTSWGLTSTVNPGGYSDFYGAWDNGAAITSFRILTSGTATFSGTVYLYELKT
jgi:hypothetical protein